MEITTEEPDHITKQVENTVLTNQLHLRKTKQNEQLQEKQNKKIKEKIKEKTNSLLNSIKTINPYWLFDYFLLRKHDTIDQLKEDEDDIFIYSNENTRKKTLFLFLKNIFILFVLSSIMFLVYYYNILFNIYPLDFYNFNSTYENNHVKTIIKQDFIINIFHTQTIENKFKNWNELYRNNTSFTCLKMNKSNLKFTRAIKDKNSSPNSLYTYKQIYNQTEARNKKNRSNLLNNGKGTTASTTTTINPSNKNTISEDINVKKSEKEIYFKFEESSDCFHWLNIDTLLKNNDYYIKNSGNYFSVMALWYQQLDTNNYFWPCACSILNNEGETDFLLNPEIHFEIASLDEEEEEEQEQE